MKNNVASAEASMIGSPIPSNAWGIELKPDAHVIASGARSEAFRKCTAPKITKRQKGAMKECFEIVLCQKRKYAVRCKRLSRPKKYRRKNRSDDDRRNKICRQFNYVFQSR